MKVSYRVTYTFIREVDLDHYQPRTDGVHFQDVKDIDTCLIQTSSEWLEIMDAGEPTVEMLEVHTVKLPLQLTCNECGDSTDTDTGLCEPCQIDADIEEAMGKPTVGNMSDPV